MAGLVRIQETYEEKQQRKQRESRQRIRALVAVCVVSVIARLVIKDPAKQVAELHPEAQVKILPGMLASLPASERARLDPKVVAQLMLADEQAKEKKIAPAKPEQFAGGAYKPAQAPEDTDTLGERAKQMQYAYAKRQRSIDEEKAKMETKIEAVNKTLIQFSNGRSLRVLRAQRDANDTTIRMAGLSATLPNRLIRSVTDNAEAWQEPVPAGKVVIKPARGITIVVDKETARRITVKKAGYDEI